ncbi:S-layer homology domain-containing protein [Brevibacillus humidisoli]|uniref:YcdB/YcdC domain-containing protein n=1 Tax=Brevibacillus humidisoli TaxID=2895522 RepID=UPI001E5CE2F3|nr:YcdB/YcdC domain-containing protein [Brevibacillus humidisoli]UFJ41500.1 S-layer homology domain-containing protein [Brevibacillus humidisoli]
MRKNRYPWSRAFVQSVLAASLVMTAVPSAFAAVTDRTSQTVTVTAESTSATTGKTTGIQLAEANISSEEAVDIAKKFVGKLDGFGGPEISHREWYYEEGPLVWEISWRQDKEPFERVQVVIDSQSGRILEYDNWSGQSENISFPPKVNYEQAVKIGEEWLKKLSDHLTGEYVHEDRNDASGWGEVLRDPNDTYNITFHAVHEGIPFPSDNINMSIDGEGNLRGFRSSSLQQVNFESKEGLLEESEIRELLAEQFEMELAYLNPELRTMREEQQEADEAYVLSYEPVPTPRLIQAKTGQAVDYQGEPIKQTEVPDEPLGPKADNSGSTAQSKPVTDKEAVEILNRFISLPEDVTVRAIEREEEFYRTDGPVWSIRMEYEYRNGSVGWGGAEIDAETGNLIYFDLTPYLYEKSEDAEEVKEPSDYPVSAEVARETALAFVKKHEKDKLHELYWTGSGPWEDRRIPLYSFEFERKVNGIRVLGNQVRVEISAETGEIVLYSENWDDHAEFPEAGQLADPAEVKEQFIQDAILELRYEDVRKRKGLNKRNPQQPVEAMLVYRFQEPWQVPTYIDAKTGVVIDRETGEAAKRKTEDSSDDLPSDIAGHPAEEALRHLVQLKALTVEDGKVNPQKVVSRGEFLDILLRTNEYMPGDYSDYLLHRFGEREPRFSDVSKEHSYYAAIEWAAVEGLIKTESKTFEPDRAITREDAAEILVTALGYEKLAELDSLFALSFADKAEIEQKGYVAIASEIGLISGAGAEYQPDAQLTRAEVATILYRFLSKRVEYRPDRKL